MNKIFFTQVWDNTKNYAVYANEFMNLLPDNAYGCFTDGDVMWLTNDYGNIIYNYVEKYPDAVLTCKTNRIGCMYQKLNGVDYNNHNIGYHRAIAEKQKMRLYQVTDISKESMPFSGMMMVVPKTIWNDVKFRGDGILGIDNNFFFDLKEHGKQILLCNGLYCYHTYRISGSKAHLL